MKLRNKMLIESYEHLLAPLLTGLASIIMMLEPLPEALGLIDLRSLPIFMAGLRYGLPLAILSTVLPSCYSFILHENHGVFIIAQDLIAPALLSSFFHNKEYRSGFLDIPIRHGLQICLFVFFVHLLTHGYITGVLSLDHVMDQLFMLIIMAATFILLIAMVNDENKNWRMQRQLEMQANQDGLTRLPNLRSFISIAKNAMRMRKVSIMMIDIDNFKQYNDHFGHLEGDQLLRDIASILRHHVQEQDYVARYGGEEFILFSTETDPMHLAAYAQRLCEAVADSFHGQIHSDYPQITISIGISIAGALQEELQQIISEADYALYESKRSGKNRFTFYTGAKIVKQKMNAY